MDRKNIGIISGMIIAVLAVNYWVFGVFVDSNEVPPSGNTPPPINVGADYQRKEGNLEVRGLTATEKITLGGVARSTWPTGGVGGGICAWEGTKCDCKQDETSTWTGSTISSKITIGSTCVGGQLTDVRVVNFQVSTGSRHCPQTPPAGCTASLYTYQND